MLEAIRATGKFFLWLAILPVCATPLCRLQRQLCAACYRDVDPRRMDDAMEEHRHDIAAHLARRFFGDDLGGEASLWKVYLYRTPPPPATDRAPSRLCIGSSAGLMESRARDALPSSHLPVVTFHFFFVSVCFSFVLLCGVACRSVVNCKWMALSNPLLADLRG